MLNCQTTIDLNGNITDISCAISDVWTYLIFGTVFAVLFYLSFIAFRK